MGYARAMIAMARGYSLRREAWIDGEFVEYSGNVPRQRYLAGRTYCFRTYIATHADMFASDWELVT